MFFTGKKKRPLLSRGCASSPHQHLGVLQQRLICMSCCLCGRQASSCVLVQFQITIQVTGLCSWPAEISLWAGGSPATNTPPPLSLSLSLSLSLCLSLGGPCLRVSGGRSRLHCCCSHCCGGTAVRPWSPQIPSVSARSHTHGSLRVRRYELPVCRDGGEMTLDLDHMSLSVG